MPPQWEVLSTDRNPAKWATAEPTPRNTRLGNSAIGLLWLTALSASSLAAQAGTERFQVRSWSRDDGLPVNAARAVRQSADGYMWIGTENGLVRFDGNDFVVPASLDSTMFLGWDISALEVGADGDLWVGTTTGLIRAANRGGSRWAGSPALLASAYIEALHADSVGNLWVGTAADGVFLVTDSVAKRVSPGGSRLKGVRDIAASGSGMPWVATEAGLARVSADTVLLPVQGTEAVDVKAVLEDRRGQVWVGTRDGLYLLQRGQLVPAVEDGPLRRSLIWAISEDSHGNLWVASSGNGLFRLAAGHWERLTEENGLPSDDIHGLAVDERGDLWVAANGGVALVYIGEVEAVAATRGQVALPVLEDHLGALWVGTFGNGVSHLHGGRARSFDRADGLPHDVVLSLAEDQVGNVWIGTRSGLAIYDGEKLKAHPSPLVAAAGVTALLAGRDGRVWAGTTNGLLVLSGSSIEAFDDAESLGSTFVLTLHEARDGSILIGTQGRGGYRLRGQTIEPLYTTDATVSSTVFSFYEDGDSSLWLGTGNGLMRIRDENRIILGPRQGIPDPVSVRMLDDDQGNLWVSTNRGVYRVKLAALNAVANGQMEAVSPRLFAARDGMPSTETNGGFHPAGWKGRDGKLYFPTMAGVAVFNPAVIESTPTRSQVLVHGFDFGSGPIQSSPSLEIPPQARDVSISYTLLDFRQGETAEFRYRLVGYDTAWVHAGERRTAYYTRLPAGEYAFAVEGRVPGQAWSSADPFVFRLRPLFYETLWFRVPLFMLGAAGLLLLHRSRVEFLRRRQRELVQLVEAKETAQRKYQEIFENAGAVVLTLDTEGRIEEANREACTILQRSRDELRGTRFNSLALLQAPGPDSNPWTLERSADNGVVELPLLRPDGSAVRLEASIRRVTEGDEHRGYQLIGRDVTDRHELEGKLRQAQRMEAVGLLAGGVAHDFNNILSVIGGYNTLMLQEIGDTDPLREDAQEIAKATDRATSLTHQLLAFSRRQALSPKVLSLNEVLIEMQRLLRRLIGEDIDFQVDLTPELWNVIADPGQVEQVVANLVLNARDAMPDGGALQISTRNVTLSEPMAARGGPIARGEYVALAVADSGSGIPEHILEHIFDPFFTTKEAGKGTGLGLATVHGIIEQSGAHIRVNSRLGQGTEFQIYLPRSTGVPEPSERRVEPVTAPSGSETLLVVDDEAPVRKLMRRVLERSGYTVLEADDPVDALENVVQTHRGGIDLLITDVVMPHMNGIRFSEILREVRPACKILFMSGHTDEKLAFEVREESLLRKPFAPDELLTRVRQVLAE